MANDANQALAQYLPAIYQDDPFLGRFLKAFEEVLLVSGRAPESPARGLEETIATLAEFFDPKQTPEEFLPWLAGWTAVSLRADLDILRQRDFIAKIAQLYRRRGTKANLVALLEIFVPGVSRVVEAEGAGFQLGVNSTIGQDVYLGGAPPHFFRVIISLPNLSSQLLQRQMEIAKAVIELEKPAHTTYKMEFEFPSMQIGKSSTVGVDTLLGTGTKPTNPA